MSKITGLRTIRLPERPNLIWVEIETDEGLTAPGLGVSPRPDIRTKPGVIIREPDRRSGPPLTSRQKRGDPVRELPDNNAHRGGMRLRAHA